MILIGDHTPHRPSWLCRRCRQPYPCPEARGQLTVAHRQTGELGLIAYELLTEAVRDLPEVSVAELWDRFVAWTEPASSTPCSVSTQPSCRSSISGPGEGSVAELESFRCLSS